MNTLRERHKAARRVIAEGLDSAWALPQFGAIKNSTAGGSSSADSGGDSSGGASASG